MLSIFVLITCYAPRIVPIPVLTAKKELNKWTYEAIANDDIVHANTYKVSLQQYDLGDSRELGCVALVNTHNLQAIVLMEKIDNKVCIWDISSKDLQSGTLLLSIFIKTMRDEFYFSNTIHNRWKLAKMYFSPSHIN